MKKVLLTFVSLLLPMIASAEIINGIVYTLSLSAPYEAEVSYSGINNYYSGPITIPSSFSSGGHTYTVTSIGSNAFVNCPGITSVTIPTTVKEIGPMAFFGCTGLTSIDLQQVQTIDNNAFDQTGLTSITIPASVTSLGYYVFNRCSSLESINVESGNSKYNSGGSGCNAIIETSSNKLITGCKNTVIPSGVTEIGEAAFSGATGLNSYPYYFNIPATVTKIGAGAFQNCTSLYGVAINGNVTRIEMDTFYGCTALQGVSGLNNVTYIGNYAFGNCTSLTSFTIPSSVTTLCNGAFYGTGITTITIPNNVATIYGNPFSGCSNLDHIIVSAGNAYFESPMGCNAIIRKSDHTVISGCNTTYFFDDMITVTSIGDEAFKDCTGLTNLPILSSVTSIGNAAFNGCTGLTSIRIPGNVTSIGNNAFGGCTGLTTISIPNSVTSIGSGAFNHCTGLTHFYCRATGIPTTSSDPFNDSNIGTNATLHVPSGSLASYQSATYWKNFKYKEALTTINFGCLVATQADQSYYDFAIDGNSTTSLNQNSYSSVSGDVYFNREFTAGKKATICLPFAVTAAKAATLGKFYQFSGLKEGSSDVVQMTEVTTGLVANTPYVFEPSATVTSIYFRSKTIYRNPAPVDPGTGSYAFQGTYSYKYYWTPEQISGGVYGFAISGFETEGFEEGAFVRLGSSATVRPFRAFLKNAGNLSDASSSASARKRAATEIPDVIRIEWISADGTTSISGVKKVDAVQDGWYSLDGRKLSDMPATKGVYINNGRKVVIK